MVNGQPETTFINQLTRNTASHNKRGESSLQESCHKPEHPACTDHRMMMKMVTVLITKTVTSKSETKWKDFPFPVSQKEQRFWFLS